ncbi:hypothetical protein GTP41_01790 [Pseudoduganella sp. DS3]|uniref:Uncharacterized protein n=1 Tax=Pseudoduganella guangdongensis TaxID=2692179 RepID=A0A6N9HCF5_9BURK|nr:hypothetical protein [Pseudoduganella guangdongensis]MYN00822.1 hypothetical protein [Pseudoduganella guangdongensis]
MSQPSITQLPELWERDGSLRDVYLTGVDIHGWERFIQYASAYRLTYKADGEDAAFPGLGEVFRRIDTSHCLSIWIDDVSVNCHFFQDDEIELDVDPGEILGETEHAALLKFVAGASNAVGVSAIITPEGSQGSPFLAFDTKRQTWKIQG